MVVYKHHKLWVPLDHGRRSLVSRVSRGHDGHHPSLLSGSSTAEHAERGRVTDRSGEAKYLPCIVNGILIYYNAIMNMVNMVNPTIWVNPTICIVDFIVDFQVDILLIYQRV